ncbi:MAG TPA: M1 family metallopeptidase [Gemmatirosa sp.]|nr:M1 family metallopeptidase [Gemmatirosa sp.]
MSLPSLLLALAVQQPTPARPAARADTLLPVDARDSAQTFAGWPRRPSRTSPRGGDTTGYWQQRADYRVIATLDETRGVVTAHGTLTYVNRSPDTLRELFLHQHLNAFRPESRWSATDQAEGRLRFQKLVDPDHAYERFTAAPTVGGTPLAVTYPGAPDSSVAHVALPRPLAPGDSVVVTLAWEARPSTVLRRQGRRGRSFDLAQWYPKVAVYDRGGWQPHALVPSGEFYGEFGDFDVTLVVRDDQVIGATGVPVSGDPGWARVSRTGAPELGRAAYANVAEGPMIKLAAGWRPVRFVARGVHHFGWSASPDYIYEGGAYVRATPARGARFPTWDTVRVHTLYRPGDDTTFGGGRAVARTVTTLGWLERVFGPYGYPQMTVLHRLETGGTEFPMLQMNGSGSLSLNLHEGGHIYAYGLLANNEWQSGWMDEGLTSYQTDWGLGLVRHEVAFRAGSPILGESRSPQEIAGLRAFLDRQTKAQWDAVRDGRAEPIGRRGDRFVGGSTYSAAVYSRAETMYGALRDVLGEEAFARFLRDYYARWAFRHVDEAAMRASAERAHGGDLAWFFDQWVHGTGNVDYALRDVRSTRDGRGWVTRATLVRAGDYRHPMPVGVLAGGAWTVVRGDARRDRQTLTIRTAAEPVETRLDPHGTTEAWAARFYVWPRTRRDLAAPSTGRASPPAVGAATGGGR